MLRLFFKLKTAYDMRISDWSSDVCSSDLASAQRRTFAHTVGRPRPAEPWPYPLRQLPALRLSGGEREHRPSCRLFAPASAERRSEEHTSELQSLMRISYAVFCLKKKKNKSNCINIHTLLATSDNKNSIQ